MSLHKLNGQNIKDNLIWVRRELADFLVKKIPSVWIIVITSGHLCVNIAGVPSKGRRHHRAEVAGHFVFSTEINIVVSYLSLSFCLFAQTLCALLFVFVFVFVVFFYFHLLYLYLSLCICICIGRC